VDYQDKTYDAKLYTNSKKLGDAISPDYDLAVLYFTADISTSNVCALPLGATNPKTGDDVISVTAPNGQQNAISFGKVKDYVNVTLSEKDETSSNVTFPVIYHDGYINNGSSGGALFDSSLYVVGVNYAGANANAKSNYKSYAVPIEKVKEFLNAYVYN
jgi:S1-C subfamily serine protease